MQNLESVNVTCTLFANKRGEQLAFRATAESGPGDRISSDREDGSWRSFYSQAGWELIWGPELPGTPETPRRQVLAHAMHEGVPEGRCSSVLGSGYSW